MHSCSVRSDLLLLALAGALLGAMIPVVTLAIYRLRPKNAPPDLLQLDRHIQEIRLAHSDLVDRFDHYVRRNRVRRLREAQDPGEDLAQPPPTTARERKAALRRKVAGNA